jgi:hypothetical protein
MRGPEFDLESGRYHGENGQFVEGPPRDYDPQMDRFRAQDGEFKNRSHYHDGALGGGRSRDRGRGRRGRDRRDRRDGDDRASFGGGGFGGGLGSSSPFAGTDDDFGAADMDESPFQQGGVLDRAGGRTDDGLGEFVEEQDDQSGGLFF